MIERCQSGLMARIKTMIRPELIYGTEAWSLKRKEELLLERTEMRMLRWILGVTLTDKKRSEEIRRESSLY